MGYRVYILHSNSLKKYYTGYSSDVEERFKKHNLGFSTFTSTGTPWEIIWTSIFMQKSDALKLEKKIKKRGARRYMTDLKRKATIPKE